MYDKKLKYKILSIFAATVMTFTAIPGRLLLTHQKKMLHLKLQV